MKGFKELSAVALSLLAFTVSAEDAAAAEAPSDVHVLKTDTFESFVKENPLVLAECLFFHHYCIWSLC
jgi:protein disulfide-isomerase A1